MLRRITGGGDWGLCRWVHACFPRTIHLDVIDRDILGVPRTGKTATVHAVVRQLKAKSDESVRLSVQLPDAHLCFQPFSHMEINGLHIPEPSATCIFFWQGRHQTKSCPKPILNSKRMRCYTS